MHITPFAYGLIGLICLGACAGFFVASLVQFFKARDKGLSSVELQKGFGYSGHGFILLGLFALFNSLFVDHYTRGPAIASAVFFALSGIFCAFCAWYLKQKN